MAPPSGQHPVLGNPTEGPSRAAAAGLRMSLRRRIVLAASSGLVILLGVLLVTIYNARQIRRSLDDLSDLHLAAETFRSINNTLLSMEASQRGFLLTGDSSYLVPFDTSMKALQRRMDSLHQIRARFPHQMAQFGRLDSLVDVRLAQMNSTIGAFSADGSPAAIRQLNRNHLTGSMDSVRTTLRGLNQVEEAERLDVRATSARASRRLVLAELLGGVIAIVLVAFALRRVFKDLDAREQAETSLRSSQRFLDSIIDLLPLMVFVKDARDLRFVRFNRTAEEMVGLPRADVLGRTDFDLFPRPLAEGFTTMDRAALASDDVRDVPEEVIVAPNGAVRTMHTRKVAIRDETGRAAFLLGVSEDVTERKRNETEVELARQAAEAANRAKSDFLAKMSHELRTPLNSIIGFSQLIEEESVGPLNDRQRRYVTNVLSSGRQLLDLINDILDLSKVEAGRMELALTHTALPPLLGEALALVEPLAVRGGLSLQLELAADLPGVLVDPARFRQIFYNLLGNAIKFTEPGGRVTLRAAVTRQPSRAGAPMVRLTVHDTGVGIRPDDLERIFLEFEQVDTDQARNRQGTGLGLALARRLTELHGGRLWAESEYGLGSSFHVELPVSPGAEASASPARAGGIALTAAPDGRPLVMVVEDDPGFAELLQHYLEDADYRVALVARGSEVMEQVSRLRPDAITMDIVLPGRDGLQLLRALKSDPRTAAIPVLVVSVTEERVRGVALGAFDWLIKPVQRDALVATVQRAVHDAAAIHPLILAIDDDPGALDVITAMLSGAGFRVLSTTDPREGVALAERERPSAITLDLTMPGLSGFEVVTALRALEATRDLPIIIFSGRDLTLDEQERLETHVQQILAKADAAVLVDELRRIGVQSGALHP
jgi:PAS domain S-box-containing protein